MKYAIDHLKDMIRVLNIDLANAEADMEEYGTRHDKAAEKASDLRKEIQTLEYWIERMRNETY